MRTPSFAAVLDDVLSRTAQDAPAANASPWAWRREPPLGSAFLFERPLTSPVARWAAAETRAPQRPAHRLTDDQRLAFERLLMLGADLCDGFTADELRREFRELARRYHPDAHGDCCDLERAQLAQAFVEATEDYRCLCKVVWTRH